MADVYAIVDIKDGLLYRSRREKPLKSAGGNGTVPRNKGPNSCCFQKHWRFSHHLCPPQNELWAHRKS